MSGADAHARVEAAERRDGAEGAGSLTGLLDDDSVRRSYGAQDRLVRALAEPQRMFAPDDVRRLAAYVQEQRVPDSERERLHKALARADPAVASQVSAHIARNPRETRAMRLLAVRSLSAAGHDLLLAEVFTALAQDPDRTWRRWASINADRLPYELARGIILTGLADESAVVRSNAAASAAELAETDVDIRRGVATLARTERSLWRRVHLRRCVRDLERLPLRSLKSPGTELAP